MNLESPRAAAAQPAGAAWPAASFGAGSRFGTVQLRLQGRPQGRMPVVPALREALLLAQAEPLVQLLEDWWGEALDFAPDAAEDSPGARAEATLGTPDGEALLQATLVLPWAALQGCRPQEAALRERLGVLQWQPVAAHLVLSRQRLARDEWQLLAQPGAALLLPESTGAAWPCVLRPAQAGAPWPALRASWEPHAGRVQWQGELAADGALGEGEVEVELRLLPTLRLQPPQLLGWDGLPQAEGARGAALLCGPARECWRGELLPLGSSWVFRTLVREEAAR